MARSIHNPFKERRMNWVRSVTIGLVVLSLLWIIFGNPLSSKTPTETTKAKKNEGLNGGESHSIEAMRNAHHSNLRDLLNKRKDEQYQGREESNSKTDDTGMDRNDGEESEGGTDDAGEKTDDENRGDVRNEDNEEGEEGEGSPDMEEEEGGGEGMDDVWKEREAVELGGDAGETDGLDENRNVDREDGEGKNIEKGDGEGENGEGENGEGENVEIENGEGEDGERKSFEKENGEGESVEKQNGEGENGEGEAEGGEYGEEENEGEAPRRPEEEFPNLTQEEYPTWLKKYHTELEWKKYPVHTNKLTRKVLQESLILGCDNIASNQKEAGNFNYQYDFVSRKLDSGDSPVRQAGALWGMALCFQQFPENEKYQIAVERGIGFFKSRSEDGPTPGSIVVRYPSAVESETGVNALFGLALVDYIRTIQDNVDTVTFDIAKTERMNILLASVIQLLSYMQNDDRSFSEAYNFGTKRKSEESSPYYDGEAMLCLCRAARYLDGFRMLVPRIVSTAPVLAKRYSLDAWRIEHDSDTTKGFYQWSSMFLTEYYQAQWEDYELYGDYVIVLAHWIIHTHEILDRNRNTGYAYEGILSAYQIAQNRGNTAAVEDLSYTIDEGIYKLCTWQVGGPLADKNRYLIDHPTEEAIAVGGVMNAAHKAPLRIDTTQHQMHALMMALAILYKE